MTSLRHIGLQRGSALLSRLARLRTVAKRLRYRFFPERQLYFRANGVVRFISISPRIQIAASALALAFVCWVALTSFNFLARDEMLAAKERKIEDMARAYDSLNAEMQRLQMDVKATAERLRARQEYLRQLVGDDAEAAGDPAPEQDGLESAPAEAQPMAFFFSAFRNSGNDPADAARAISAIETELTALASRQRVIAERLLALTQHEINEADHVLRSAGLNKSDVLKVAERSNGELGQGGPFMPWGDGLFSGTGDAKNDVAGLEDPFMALYERQNELASLAGVFANMPVTKPVKNYYISSGYGRRIDPMRKSRAMHYGVDMAGWWNTPITASGGGVVTFAGRNGAYGNFVEVSHGNGFRSRYGHLKRIKVKKGQRVERGQVVGLMGSTGRSTGPHLHYEVWFADKPLNPLKIFKAEDDVLKIQQQHALGAG